jgi:predicted HicB family RNase H-like nuclease
MSLQNDRYTYRITWSEEDKEYVGLCIEFPSLSWLARTPEAALQGIRKIVREAVIDMRNHNETPPSPLSARSYSGKFVLRVPPEVHRELALKAAEEGISLNRLISSKLGN